MARENTSTIVVTENNNASSWPPLPCNMINDSSLPSEELGHSKISASIEMMTRQADQSSPWSHKQSL